MRVGGLASGMDTDSIVKEMMAAQKIPLDKLTQKKAFTEWQQEALRDTNLSMISLRDSAAKLRLQGSFNSYTAASSNPASVSVVTNANAMSGTYKVQVESVASSAKMNSATSLTNTDGNAARSTDTIGMAGIITIAGADGSSVEIEIEEDTTYADVAKKIQAETADTTPALRASFDNTTSRFFIATKGMGENQNFTMSFTGTSGSDEAFANKILNNEGAVTATTIPPEEGNTAPNFVTAATNGKVKFDNIEIDGLTSNTTTVNGLTINLLQPGAESTITVSSDPAKPLEMIKDFVEEYNKIIGDLEKQLVEKRYPDFQPLSTEQKKDMTDNEIELWEEKARSGLLRNDPILKNALQDLRRAFMDEVEEIPDGNFKHLSQIGINTGTYTEGGKLFIDEDVLTKELADNPDEIMQLFTYKDAEGNGLGVGDRVYATLNEVVKNLGSQAGSPGSSADNSTITKKIRQMNDDIKRWEDRLTRIEDRYWKQFTAMEKALSQMNSQSAWMQQSLFGGM